MIWKADCITSISSQYVVRLTKLPNDFSIKGALAIRRIFSLVDMITKPKFSNCPNVFKIGLFR